MAGTDAIEPARLPVPSLRALRGWTDRPAGWLVLLIVASFAARLLFAAALGLGIDESYMVAAGRRLAFGYYDHPPAAWWLAWLATHLTGSQAPVIVRLPFLLLFALSTWLIYLLGRQLYGAAAGLWAAVLLNAAPVFGLTTASWVLPDGPLVAALLGSAYCLVRGLDLPTGRPSTRASLGWWLGAGLCAGLALFSKYSAILTLAGAFLYLLTDQAARPWLRRPEPWLAAAAALAVFAPVIGWNAAHGWASFAFQAGRAGHGRLHPFGPLVALGGEILFLLPWIGLPLLLLGGKALWRGPADRPGWLLACLALPPILIFALLALHTHVLFHWAAPGYLMLFPLLGAEVARRRRTSRSLRVGLMLTGVLVLLGATLVGTEVRFNWLPEIGEHFALGHDPDLEAVDWTSLMTELRARGLLNRPGLVVAGLRWHDAGKLDYALDGAVPVICLGHDPREYGLLNHARAANGATVLIVAPRISPAQIQISLGADFAHLRALPPATLTHAGTPAMRLPLYLGEGLTWPK